MGADGRDDLWVFGYGSLMWRPGFEFAERHPATLDGFRRALCLYSYEHRGTEERPGIVAGLDEGGSCRGMAFRVEARLRAEVHAYLRTRELGRYCYREEFAPVAVHAPEGTRTAEALCYVVDRTHEQYCGELDLERKTGLVLQGVGISGSAIDYLESLVDSLGALDIHDPGLIELRAAVRRELAGVT
jgi:cation transport protein ChaC